MRQLYRILRSVVFVAAITVAFLYILLYVVLSAPQAQRKLADLALAALVEKIGAEVEIGSLDIMPFNEVIINDLVAYTPEGEKFLSVSRIGAGISIFKFITSGEIEFSYVEVLGLDASVSQEREDGPLNIQFLFDAFASKEKDKPAAQFDLQIRNVILRKCRISFDKIWQPQHEVLNENLEKTDFNHFYIDDLKADISLPRISNDEIRIDLRRLAFVLSGGLELDRLSLKGYYSPGKIEVSDWLIAFGETRLTPYPINIECRDGETPVDAIKRHGLHLIMDDNPVSPADLGWLVPQLRRFPGKYFLSILASSDLKEINLSKFNLYDDKGFDLNLNAYLGDFNNIKESSADIDDFHLSIPSYLISEATGLIEKQSPLIERLPSLIGDLEIEASLKSKSLASDAEVKSQILSDLLELDLEANATDFFRNVGFSLAATIKDLGKVLNHEDFGDVDFDMEFDGRIDPKNIKDLQGRLEMYVKTFEYKGENLGNLIANLQREENILDGNISIDNVAGKIEIDLSGDMSKDGIVGDLYCSLSEIELDRVGAKGKFSNTMLNGNIALNLSQLNSQKIDGSLNLRDFTLFSGPKRLLKLEDLTVTSGDIEGERVIDLKSDWFDANVSGNYMIRDIPPTIMDIFHSVMPALANRPASIPEKLPTIEFEMIVHPDNSLISFLNLPIKPLVPVNIFAGLNGELGILELALDAPYIQQGKDKLIYDTRLNIVADRNDEDLRIDFDSNLPAKNGDVALSLDVRGEKDVVSSDIRWESHENKSFKGLLSLAAEFLNNPFGKGKDIRVNINPSIVSMGAEDWFISPSTLTYSDNVLAINGFRVGHDSQFVEIGGKASKSLEDVLNIRLSEIDVDYVFDTLKINYVTFGGEATGLISGKALFSKDPIAHTEELLIKNLSYNGTVVGDGDISSHWDNAQKEVAISAIISKDGRQVVDGRGGVFLGADSLCFDIKAEKVAVGFVQPFMQAFSSHVGGEASGEVRLAGNFHDIDLTGKIFADSVSIKLDYTQTYYHGSDSVYLNPGKIIIPGFKIYDKFGNSALVTGELSHRYFHDPVFTFKLSDADGLLCYDTTSADNPDWYGTVFGRGGAVIRGWPQYVDIGIDMTLMGNSTFTFVLNETQAAADYNFLTFTDRRREAMLAAKKDNVTDFKELFKKRAQEDNEGQTSFDLDVRATVTPSVLFVLVMDPAAGDKITARGSGAMQIEYNSDDDKMTMFGKYTIDEGNYNFSLQDLILRDFKIKEGSFITFNGDPLDADLDISAAYRVNTNLSDLDKSFSTDRDLARTNVPVDAILKVDGHMTSPNITFDIDLPTLTQDVERKVRSIISTDDMMNRQIIYLLALNRFYTPEYMGNSSNGGELAAVASTTLSSQLSNMIGQLTDKFTLSPSFRSDKGDFSDIEVDVALSSRLLNNRLLLNGNFGYRDKSTSSTTFIGDFDIEYLLNKRGNLRLKAYNHFNDQNYYLREALTTQGLGVVYRKEFDNPFTFLKKKKTKESNEEKSETENRDTDIENSDDLLKIQGKTEQ